MSKKKKPIQDDVQPEPNDSPETPETPADPLEAMTLERDDLLARLQRLAADYQNYQKRVQKDVAQAREYANESLLKEMLTVLDDMENALTAAAENHDADDPMLTGMTMVHDKLVEMLGRFGLEAVNAIDQPFDPELHSAMMQEPRDDVEPMTVLQQLQKGYTLKGRALRPAAVIVSKAVEEE